MTNLIDDIKRDRESGTSGPFAIGFRGDFSAWFSIGDCRTGAHKQGDIFLEGSRPGDVVDARRIARVPQMEDSLLDAVEALEAIERGDDSVDGMQGDIARAALEAMK